ncbi:DIM/SIM/IMP family subclass B1 metallo-beta-lactamase [Gilvimarinus polysaccharolyticus]|uniref:DIM/SIM/IMP family subclass B1 metallo-beta-lactamase n=1 Tax=Gilvimarinus polysaccharolyticus TaxID=863921 RepID=UPI000673AF0A|nr:DIM/SIM/IMP family subclass B1 metallo-beta-lactamase [Gilvimarinus polysaccharolyticus]
MKKTFVFLLIVIVLPAFAQSEKSLEIRPLTPNVYLHTSFKQIEGYGLVDSNGLIVIDGEDAYLIDTPWSEADTQQLLSWLADRGYKLMASVSTHSHEDRTAGIKMLNAMSVPTYTSQLTQTLLERDDRSLPTHAFAGDEFTLGGGLIELYYPGAGHTQDNIVAWLPNSNLLFGGCLVRAHEWEGLGYVGEASISVWADSIRNIKAREYAIDLLVPGHGKVGGAGILDHTIKLAEAAHKK